LVFEIRNKRRGISRDVLKGFHRLAYRVFAISFILETPATSQVYKCKKTRKIMGW
jgi:hypothetical protein